MTIWRDDRRPGETTKERQARKRAEWRAELSRLHAKREQRIEYESNRRRSDANLALLARIHDELRGPAFRAWYEATTGEPVEPWLDYVAVDPAEFVRRYPFMATEQLDWTRMQVELVARLNRWRDPEQRALWSMEVQQCRDGAERRYITQRLATPPWVDRRQLARVYAEREAATVTTGLEHHVDHVIPILHRDVCGLHVPWNLRVIPATENVAKGNRRWPGMS